MINALPEFPEKYSGLSLLDELAIIRMIARDCKKHGCVTAYLKCCGLISSIVQTQNQYNGLRVYTKEICLFSVCGLIRSSGHSDQTVALFVEELAEKWQVLDFDVNTDVHLMDESVPPLIDEYVPDHRSIVPTTSMVLTSKPYSFTVYDVPEVIQKESVGADSLSLLEEVGSVRQMVAERIIPVFKDLWRNRESEVYPALINKIILETPQVVKMFSVLIGLIQSQLSSIRFAIDTIEGIDFANVAMEILKKIECHDVVDKVREAFIVEVREGTSLLPSKA